MPWDPTQYLKFADLRLRPALDLLQRITLTEPAEIYDLGSGAGNVTAHLRARWPQAHITGVEQSEAMLRKAAELPGIDWVQADLATWQPPRPPDLLYANASLHWLGDHQRLFPSLLAMLTPGGVLAVQMPRQFSEPARTLFDAIAQSGPWRDRLEPLLRPSNVSEPAWYYDLLAPHAATVDLWETEYFHVLEGADPVKEWYKGSWLSHVLDALDEPRRSEFEAVYTQRVAEAYPRRPDGRTVLPFPLLFIVATVAGR